MEEVVEPWLIKDEIDVNRE